MDLSAQEMQSIQNKGVEFAGAGGPCERGPRRGARKAGHALTKDKAQGWATREARQLLGLVRRCRNGDGIDRKTHAAQQIGVARVRADIVQLRLDGELNDSMSPLIGLIEELECLVVLS